jgi:alpha-glucosidase
MDTLYGFINKLSVPQFRTRLDEAETQLHGNPPLLVLENHDNPRSLNRYGGAHADPALGKLLATLLLAPRCAALVYYGEELGMENNDPKRKEDVRDPVGRTGWPKDKGRDGERSPMQWTAGPQAGFSSAELTWLPVAPDYKTRNVAVESKDSASLLNYYRALIRLRRENPALSGGEFALNNASDGNVLSWIGKTRDGKATVVAVNFTASPQTIRFDAATQATTLLSSFSKAGDRTDLKNLTLPPYGTYIGGVSQP